MKLSVNKDNLVPLFIFLVSLHWLLHPVHREVVKVDVLTLLPIFGEKHKFCVSYRFFTGGLYQTEEFPFYSKFAKGFTITSC